MRWSPPNGKGPDMPSGHTAKQTMTPYRRALLGQLPQERRHMNHAERKQLGDMEGYGWVVVLADIYVVTVLEGRKPGRSGPG